MSFQFSLSESAVVLNPNGTVSVVLTQSSADPQAVNYGVSSKYTGGWNAPSFIDEHGNVSTAFSPTPARITGNGTLTLTVSATSAASPQVLQLVVYGLQRMTGDPNSTVSAHQTVTVAIPAVAIPNPVAWWQVNKGTGSIFHDSSGNAIDLTVNGSGGSWSTLPGKTVQSYNFAVNQAATASSYNAAVDFGTSNPWSVTGWVNIAAGQHGGTVAGNLAYTDNFEGWVFYASNSSAAHELQIQVVDNPSNQIAVVSNTGGSIALGTTYFVAGTYDGSGHAAGVKLYINGVSVPVTIAEDNVAGGSNSTQPVSIGGMGLGSVEPFVGHQADIRVYNTVLTATQIQALYLGGPL